MCRPCKAICLGRLTQLLPLSLLRKSKSHNAPQGSVLLGTALHSPTERVDLPLPTAIRLLGTAGAPITVDWSPSGMTACVGAKGVHRSQAWHPRVQMCGYFLICSCLTRSIIFCILSYGDQAAFLTSGRCRWVWIWALAYPQEMFQCKLNQILEGLSVQKTSAGDMLHC